jgi:hypothetical protein
VDVDGGVNGIYSRILINRLISRERKEGFGNIQALEDEFAKAFERQAERLHLQEIKRERPLWFLSHEEDMIGLELW